MGHSLMRGRRRRWRGRGMLLVGIGVLLLVGQLFGFSFWGLWWPFFVMLPGLFLFLLVKEVGKRAAGLTIPASMMTALGLLFFYQNFTGHWESWAYAWTLIVPMALGLGIATYGDLARKPGTVQAGERLARMGLGMFAMGAIFFEMLLNISGFMSSWVTGPLLSILVIMAGVYLLRRRERPSAGRPPLRERPIYELDDDAPWRPETPVDERRSVRS